MSSYFLINNVENKLKNNYILLSTGQKGQEIKNAQLTPVHIWKYIQDRHDTKTKQMGRMIIVYNINSTELRNNDVYLGRQK